MVGFPDVLYGAGTFRIELDVVRFLNGFRTRDCQRIFFRMDRMPSSGDARGTLLYFRTALFIRYPARVYSRRQTVSVEQTCYKRRPRSVVQCADMPSARTAPELLPIHVVIVEDDPGLRNALSRVVQAAPDMRLTGVAGTRAEGLALLQNPPADVLLVDLGLPDGSGIDVIRAAVLQWPSCSIMVCTNFGDETHVMRSIEAGAAGYLLKDSSPAKMIDEIRSLASGGSPISPIIARQILARFRQNSSPGGTAHEPARSPSLHVVVP
jgi:DNA-binding NarL/FixJ family response regulator